MSQKIEITDEERPETTDEEPTTNEVERPKRRRKAAAFRVYGIDPEIPIIAGPDHRLYDPDGNTTFNDFRVESIDRGGRFQGMVYVWYDPDRKGLYVIDGRGNTHDVREVNRRRRERGDKEIELRVTEYQGTLEDALDAVTEYNFLRKVPPPSHYAREIYRLIRRGKDWPEICRMVGVVRDDPEQWCRRTGSLSWLIPAAQRAFDESRITKGQARKILGTTSIEGDGRNGEEKQAKLLEEMLAARTRKREPRTERPLRPWVAKQWRESLGLREVKTKDPDVEQVAGIGVAVLDAMIDGNVAGLRKFPVLREAIEPFLQRKPMAKARAKNKLGARQAS